MRRSTIIGCFVGLLALTMNAQVTQPSTSRSDTRTTVENQKKPAASVQELLVRYQNVGSKPGAVSEYFTIEEQQMLLSYFSNQKSANAAHTIKGVSTNNSAVAKELVVSDSQRAAFKNPYTPLFVASDVKDNSAEAKGIVVSAENRAAIYQQTQPLFIAPVAVTAEDEAEILAAAQRSANTDIENITVTRSRTILSDIIPTAGAIETFTPAVGDNFFDPGGPGGSSTGGTPGNYPNCGCDTVTTLDGATEVDFQFFSVFATFDYLRIYDGADTSGTVLYDNSSTGANSGDITLADMIGSNGSSTFTGTSGSLTFFFHSSTVVDYGGWDAEITAVSGGGGGTVCSQSHPFGAVAAGASGSSVDSTFKTAADLVVAAGEDFTLDTIEVPFLTFAPLDPPTTANIVYYENAGGLPGAIIGSETVVPTILSSGPWANPAAFQFLTSLAVTPFTFTGDASVDKTYWVEISMGTATNQATVFWEYTNDIPVEGEPYAKFDSTIGTWAIDDPTQEVVYDFSGNCEPMSGGGVACSQDHPFGAAAAGASGSSVDSTFKTAADLVVVAGEDFTLDTIEVPFLTFAPLDPPTTANIVYYENAGGLPGAIIGSETVVPTILSSGPWANPAAFQFLTSLAVTPFTFAGDASVDKTYWVEISMGTATNQATVFWEYTNDIPVEGEPYAKFDSTIGTWAIDDPIQEVVYTFSGQCDPMGGGGPGPLTTVYGINNANQDLIGFGVTTPGTTEVFGTSPITDPALFENAGAIDPANPTTGYALDNGGNFYSFDVTTGFYTSLGSIPGDWVGMEFDRSSGILYAIAGADLYTIDPVAVTATLVGATGINPADLPIALAIDGAGVGYTYEIVTDNLYSIDLATGTATLIGNIGFDANFGQGMCYDPTTDMVYMSAFNGGSFAAEWRSVDLSTGTTSLIGPIVTPAATTQVAWASIGETLPPPACPEPTNLMVTNIGATSADLSWDAEPNASSGYIWYVFDQGANPTTDTPVATGTTAAGVTTATASGLGGGFNYDFYVVADCNTDGLSQYAGPITFATPPACGGKFYDTGGPGGDYQNDENVTTTINPANAGEQVTVTFTAFDVESSWDALYVYDGPDASFPIISSGNPATNSGFPAGGYYGTTIPGPFVSSDPSGALTFVFRSDSSVPRTGWEADVTCALSPPPNDLIVNSIDVDEIGFPYTDPAVHMPAATLEGGNPVNCDLTGANGVWYNFVSAGNGTANAMIVTPGGASSVTFYTAPNENAVETDLTLVPQQTNQCLPGTSASIFTLAGQAYYVFVLNSGAVTDIMIDGTNLSTSDNSIAGFSYYPNPTTEVLNLSSVDNIERVSIYNLLGQMVIDSRVDATTSQMDVSALSTGTYLMKVTVNGQVGTYKLVKD
ncbi:T9SS type A sorting domain-containing protein [Aequorivita sp. CIP111184]|uniref:T9SS type A sorting domain-containing protein n=1 Tax=Aequorivita sp. CIP111184 TaxID=2211356 RepID=UPI000DBC1929|nr:T9SS type A sorting domain-containing protein [Aequorivita sp. CIP111184]SRX55619.1 hypothetical protein AEQU1_02643 [Aequorivita sp. CIP111184]